MGENVLLVGLADREAASLQRALEGLGCPCAHAADVTAGAAARACGDYAVVLLSASGDTVGQWREHAGEPQSRRCPTLVAVTDRSDAGHLRQLVEQGADDYLVLPAEPEVLQLRLRVFLRRAGTACAYRRPSAARAGHRGICPLADDVPFGVFRSSVEGRFLEVNDSLVRMLGYESQDDLLRVQLVPDVYRQAEDRRRLLLAPGDYLENIVFDWRRRDGTLITVRLSGRVCRSPSGEAKYFEGIVQDITEQVRAEAELRSVVEQLRRSEQRYRLIAENVRDVIWTSELPWVPEIQEADAQADTLLAQWRFTYLSPSITGLLGYTPDEARALSLPGLLPADSLERARQALVRSLALASETGGQVQDVVEVEQLHKDGSRRWCEVTVSLLPDRARSLIRILGITRDISPRRRAEQALRASERTLRTLFENLPDVVLIVDAQGVVEFASGNVSRGEGEELVGRSHFHMLQPDHRVHAETVLAQTLQTARPHTIEVQDIRESWWVCRMVPLRDAIGGDRVMIICTDITERRAAEQAVLAEQRLLRQLLNLHERDRQLISYEIHDGFAQQLTGALFNLQAYRQIRDSAPAEAAELLANGMQLLADSIDKTRQLISGLRPPILDELGIVAAIEYLTLERRRGGVPSIVFEHDVRFARLAPLLEATLFRIVEELLQNACRHSNSTVVRVDLRQEDEWVWLRIRDWGDGFDPGAVDSRCFGLRGLRERTRLLGGSLVVESARGKGTTISVELPLVLPLD